MQKVTYKGTLKFVIDDKEQAAQLSITVSRKTPTVRQLDCEIVVTYGGKSYDYRTHVAEYYGKTMLRAQQIYDLVGNLLAHCPSPLDLVDVKKAAFDLHQYPRRGEFPPQNR